MQPRTERGPLLDHLDEIELECKNGDPSLQRIFDIFGSDGHYVLITFLIIPFLQPIPLLGLSTPFGLLMALIAALAYLEKPPWIPKSWAQRKISATTVLRIVNGSERVFEKLQLILHPRWKFLFSHPFKTVNALLFIINAVLLALPLPIPFSNVIPAWAIAFLALAHLEEDGFFVTLSYIATTICLFYFFWIAKGVGAGIELFG